ncbi:MAG: hypothetical protein ACE5DQ_02535 [Candidatus Paceibacterota bacterium]
MKLFKKNSHVKKTDRPSDLADRQLSEGFTLLEIVIFVMLISLIFIAIAQATAVSIRSNITNQHKLLGTHYAEELREWLRAEKDEGWSSFLARSSPTGTQYCFNDEGLSGWVVSGSLCGINYDLYTRYKRDLTLTQISGAGGVTEVKADIVISWKEGSQEFTVASSTIFAPWE